MVGSRFQTNVNELLSYSDWQKNFRVLFLNINSKGAIVWHLLNANQLSRCMLAVMKN